MIQFTSSFNQFHEKYSTTTNAQCWGKTGNSLSLKFFFVKSISNFFSNQNHCFHENFAKKMRERISAINYYTVRKKFRQINVLQKNFTVNRFDENYFSLFLNRQLHENSHVIKIQNSPYHVLICPFELLGLMPYNVF